MDATNVVALTKAMEGVDVVQLMALLQAVKGIKELSVEKCGEADAGGPEPRVAEVAEDGGGSSGISWADQMEDGVSVSSGSVQGLVPVPEEVRHSVKFGCSDEEVVGSSGTMAKYVRSSAALRLRGILMSHGIKMPRSAAWHLALVTHSAATMPEFFSGGKDKLRTFAVLGDAALVAALASQAIVGGRRLEGVQVVRNTVLTDAIMQRRFAESAFADCVSVAAGVNFQSSKTGATALEAIVGLAVHYGGLAHATRLAKVFNLF